MQNCVKLMKLRFFLTLITIVMCISITNAQQLKKETDNPKTIWQLAKHDAKYTLKSVGHAFTRPLHWKGNDYAKLGIILGSTALLSFADEPIRDFAQQNRGDFPKIVRDFGWYFGSPQNYFMANAGLYGFGLFTRNEKIRKTSVLIISASLTTGLIQSFTKNAVGRARPGRYLGNNEFRPFISSSGFSSFPSGHTVLAVTMAHSIAKQFKNPWLKTGIYAIGAIPPISRIIDDAHWITDIAVSTVLSVVVVDAIDKFLNKEKAYNQHNESKKRVSWNLRFSTNQIGFVGNF